MVKDNRQGYALLAVMVIIWLAAVGGISFFEAQGAGVAPQLAHGAMEGTETPVRHARLARCSRPRPRSPRPAR